MKHTITFLTDEGELFNLHVGTNTKTPAKEGYWNKETNQILLGELRWSEWLACGQDNAKRKKFLEKLTVVDQALLV